MPPAPRRILGAGAAFGCALALGLSATSPAHAASTGKSGVSVSYLGHRFNVPSNWRVVNLASSPTACVRFDVHALYLGTPGANQNCPSRVLGKTDSLLVSPTSATASSSATENATAHQITSTAAGVTVTAAYATDPSQITGILTGAGLPRPSGAQTTSPRAATPRTTAPRTAVPKAAVPNVAVVNNLTHYIGSGFDACSAPSASTMSAWHGASPYTSVGIYIGGVNRSCGQPNLTAGWVSQEAAAGWHFFPLYVGLQAPNACNGCAAITSPASQGVAAADDAVAQAQSLGIGPANVIYYDMEAYSSSQSTTVLTFMSAWTGELHAKGYQSGEYSSLDSGIMDLINNYSGGTYLMPDVIDFADWDGLVTTYNSQIPTSDWANHQRMHQYAGGHNETYGGIQINIDSDYTDTGAQRSAPPPPVHW